MKDYFSIDSADFSDIIPSETGLQRGWMLHTAHSSAPVVQNADYDYGGPPSDKAVSLVVEFLENVLTSSLDPNGLVVDRSFTLTFTRPQALALAWRLIDLVQTLNERDGVSMGENLVSTDWAALFLHLFQGMELTGEHAARLITENVLLPVQDGEHLASILPPSLR